MVKLQSNRVISFLIIFILCYISYFYALSGDFIGDDVARIVEFKGLAHLGSALSGELQDRPLLMVSLWFDRIFFMLNPFWMRLENIIIHSIIYWNLFLYFIEEKNSNETRSTIYLALSVCILMALHPLHNQTINILVQRGVLLAALFGVLSLKSWECFLKSEEIREFFKTIIFLSLGILSKQTLFFLPFYFVWLSFWKKKKFKPIFFFLFLPLIIPIFYYFVAKTNVQTITFSIPQYFLTQTEVILVYLRLMVAPVGLKYLYDFYPPKNLIFNINWLFIVIHIGIIVLAYRLDTKRVFFHWVVGFYFSLAPESSIFPIMHLAFEHRTYIPMIFLTLMLLSVFANLTFHIGKIALFGISSIAIFYISLNQIRNWQIHSENDWKLHTLQHSTSHHINNVKFSIDLMRASRLPEIEGIVSHYHTIYPNALLYQMLDDIYLYFKQNKNMSHLKSLSDKIANFELQDNQRAYLNFFILEEILALKSPNLEDLIFFERNLANQHKIFWNQPKEYQSVMSRYLQLNQKLSTEIAKSFDLKKNFQVDFLRMRTIAFYYYAINDRTIEKDIEKELMTNQNSKILIRLKQMVKESK